MGGGFEPAGGRESATSGKPMAGAAGPCEAGDKAVRDRRPTMKRLMLALILVFVMTDGLSSESC